MKGHGDEPALSRAGLEYRHTVIVRKHVDRRSTPLLVQATINARNDVILHDQRCLQDIQVAGERAENHRLLATRTHLHQCVQDGERFAAVHMLAGRGFHQRLLSTALQLDHR